MRTNRLQHLLAGTALGLALTLSHGALAQTTVDSVPVPNTEQLPPPTASDIGTVAPAASAKPEPSTMPMVDTAAAPQDLDAPVAEKLREKRRQARPDLLAPERAHRRRGVLQGPQFRAAMGLRRQAERGRQGCERVSRPASTATGSTRRIITVPDFKSGDAGFAGGRRAAADRQRADLRAARCDRTHRLEPRFGRHQLQPSHARAG